MSNHPRISDFTGEHREQCRSCRHWADASEMQEDLTFAWENTGYRVCRDAEACYRRWREAGMPEKPS